MNKSKRDFLKNMGFTRVSWGHLRVLASQIAKDAKRDYDRAKSKHIIEKRWNKGHKAWSIEAGMEGDESR